MGDDIFVALLKGQQGLERETCLRAEHGNLLVFAWV